MNQSQHRCIATINVYSGVSCLDWSPDGSHLVAGLANGEVIVLNISEQIVPGVAPASVVAVMHTSAPVGVRKGDKKAARKWQRRVELLQSEGERVADPDTAIK
jgi:hypothetical protein